MRAETRVGIFVLVAIGLFIYLSINIKVFRLDANQYTFYKTYFDDTGGLDQKSPVRIAGVDVGWVEKITLLDAGKAVVDIRVNKKNKLSRNAYATISQEGLIGTKILEIDPGDSSTGLLIPGSTLSMPGKSPASVSDLLDQFRDIASNIGDIALSIKGVVSTQKGETDMKLALNGLAKTADKMADFSAVLERTMRKNEENINMTFADLRKVMAHLDQGLPNVEKDFHDVNENFHKLTLAFADDTLPNFSKASDFAGNAFKTIDDTAVQARETFREAEKVAEKINTGKGLIGKLINEDETYTDLKKTIKGFKDYVTKTQTLSINVDMHSEEMFLNSNSKGYFDLRIRPSQDSFYVLQLVTSKLGSIIRENVETERFDESGKRIYVSDLEVGTDEFKERMKIENPEMRSITTRRKNDVQFGFQFGKRYDRLAFRVGLFENTFGVGVDWYLPIQTDKLHLITTLEAFDFNGTGRIDDHRLHVKWLNRLFFMKHIYSSFGVDDFMSKKSTSIFWGGGIRFGDDDLKYVFSMLPFGSTAKK